MASPNSVLSEHAFKRLQLGSDDEDDEEGAYGSDADEGLEGFQGDDEELAIARLGLPDELVATLEKRGITRLFPIQVSFSLLLYLVRLFYLTPRRSAAAAAAGLAVGRGRSGCSIWGFLLQFLKFVMHNLACSPAIVASCFHYSGRLAVATFVMKVGMVYPSNKYPYTPQHQISVLL